MGQAFASMMGQVKGHTRMFVVRDLNQAVRPATMMTTKVTIQELMAYAELLGGVVQAATGDAIVDCLAEGICPRKEAEELCMIITVWLDPRCAMEKRSTRRISTAPTTRRPSSQSPAP